MNKRLLLPMAICLGLFANAQTVSTLSGDPGVEGYNAMTTTIANARFTALYGIVCDSFDRVWITEAGNSCRIRVIDPGVNQVLTKTGSGLDPTGSGNWSYVNQTGNQARYATPMGIAIGPNGDFYIADFDNHAIRRTNGITTNVGSGQTVSTFAGEAPGGSGTGSYLDGTGTDARFYNPADVCVDANGNLYVVDQGNECVRKITPGGTVSLLAGSTDGTAGDMLGTGNAARFNHLVGIAMLDADHVVVTDCFNNKIKKINTSTGVVTLITGKVSGGHKDGLLADAEFSNPTGIDVDAKGNIFVSEGLTGQSNVIRKISSTGVTTVAGRYQELPLYRDGQDTSARFYQPMHIAFNWKKNELFVTDVANVVVRKIDFKPQARIGASKRSENINKEIILYDSSLNAVTSRLWTITPANFTWEAGTDSTSQNPKVKFTQAGTYTVKMVATNDYGSSEKTEVAYISISNVNGLEPVKFDDILTLYPNPSHSSVFMKAAGIYSAENLEVKIFDFSGKLVMTETTQLSNGNYLKIDGLSAGAYIVRVNDGVQQVNTKLIIR